MSDTYGSGLNFGEGNPMSGGPIFEPGPSLPPPITQPIPVPDTPVATSPAGAGVVQPEPAKARGGIFGSGLSLGTPNYQAPDPALSALDQSADLLSQRVKRANEVATNPLLQVFNPEGVQKARDFVPKAAEELQKIRTQQAGIKAGRQQAETLGLAPGEVADEATTADRVEVAKARALKGDLRVFKGLQAVDPKAAESIQDQVQETVAGHLTKAQLAFDSLSGMQNQGQYMAKLNQLRNEGTLSDLEALGLKVPPTYEAFGAVKAKEGMALREARIGVDTIRQKLEERNTYQPMEKNEAETYKGRMTTVHGDQITNGTWGRNASAGTRGLIVNGAADPRDLGKKFVLASPEQRKAIAEEINQAVPKADLEKQRAFDRTYELATKVTTDGVYDDGKGGKVRLKKGDDFPPNAINTNPNVQQGIAEGLASMLRGGTGGANVGLLKIESDKRGAVQGVLDSINSAYAGGLNTLSGKEVKPYLTKLTQSQIRDVMEVIKAHNDALLEDRVAPIARRAGALGLDTTSVGFGKDEATGTVAKAFEQGRLEQIERMLPNHQAIGGGDGVFQLGAQRPGANAVTPPGGTAAPTTQLPGAPPVATPVQQSQNPTAPPTPVGGGAPPAAPVPGAPAPSGPPAGGGSPPVVALPAPVTVAGQKVAPALPPGASPNFVPALARIESGNVKDPWTAQAGKGPDGKQLSSASGAYQMLDRVWEENKPPGATATRAKDATPEQQTAAFANLTAKNAKSLQANGLPVNDTTLYVAHNLGAGGAATLMQADPNADARTVVGEAAARNNPTFFKGRPTVAKVLERYTAEMNKTPAPDDEGPKPKPGAGGATAEAPSLMTRISRMLSQGVAGGDEAKDKAVADIGNAAVEHAPAIGSVVGAAGGSLAGPGGTVAGGAVGGGAGQSLKDYLQGRAQNPTEIAKQTALGGVLGVGTAARPVLSAAARVTGSAAVEGGAAAVEGKDAGEIVDAAAKGGAAAVGGELFGRALGMVGHKVFNMFAPESKAAVQSAAAKYSDAEAVLAKEAPTIPGAAGQKATPNPAYLTAEANKLEAERVLKDAGLKPEEAAYAHKVSSEGVPKQEAQAAKPGAVEKQRIGEGYQQLETEVGAKGRGAPKAAPKLPDGPRAAVEGGKVSAKHTELAERTEMAITAPAANWQEKWVQLKDARSALLEAERDAMSSTAPGKSQIARDMRELADTVRVQQDKAAKYVFGEKDGAAFMERLKTLDTRYRRLVEATGGGTVDGVVKAAALKGEAGRDADRKFRAFAHDDPAAIAAWDAMRKGTSLVRALGFMQHIPVVEKAIPQKLVDYLQARASGDPAKFIDFLKRDPAVNQGVRDFAADAARRGAVMQ